MKEKVGGGERSRRSGRRGNRKWEQQEEGKEGGKGQGMGRGECSEVVVVGCITSQYRDGGGN